MNVDDFRQLYVTELQELRSVEDQLVQALPRMIEAAQNPQLKQAIETHLNETRHPRPGRRSTPAPARPGGPQLVCGRDIPEGARALVLSLSCHRPKRDPGRRAVQ